MTRTGFFLAAGLIGPAALLAQTKPPATAFQQADSLAAGHGGRGGPANSLPIPRAETGKPFSALATTQTIQTYADGTHISQTTSMLEYRDAQGRVRTETSEPGVPPSETAKSIMIRDPVAGVTYKLDPVKKTAVKLATAVPPTGPASPPAAGGRGGRGGNGGSAPDSSSDVSSTLERLQTAMQRLQELVPALKKANSSDGDIVEDLGTRTINGIPARGTRTTAVVPVGAIGNDREFRSVSERWFSSDLNLLIKSVNTDLRFGATTYELTNISRQPPDPSLFQVPPDYKPLPALASNVIEEIDFRGMNRVSPETIKATVVSKPGDVYDEEALRRDFAALWKTGIFSDVQLNTETGPRGGIIVRFIVTERR